MVFDLQGGLVQVEPDLRRDFPMNRKLQPFICNHKSIGHGRIFRAESAKQIVSRIEN